MNKKELQRIRNDNYRQYVDSSKSLSGESRYGIVRINTTNSLEHEEMKLKICYDLKESEQQFLTECKFKNGMRADIFILDTAEVIEIVHSETEERLVKKTQNYPRGIKILVVRTKGVVL